jgi:hypothetical protein
LDLFKQIDERAERVYKLFKTRIKLNAEISFTSPLIQLKPYLTKKISDNQIPMLDEIKHILCDEPVWKSLLLQLNPDSLLSLSKQYAEAVAEIQDSFNENGRTSLILKNPKEANIFYSSQKLADLLCAD